MQHYYASHDAYSGTPPPQLPFATHAAPGRRQLRDHGERAVRRSASFVLTATRTGAMASDACGDFTYDNLGRRDLVAGTFASGRSAATCWR